MRVASQHRSEAHPPPFPQPEVSYGSSALCYVIARVYGLTNEVQKRYMTKCIGDMSIS